MLKSKRIRFSVAAALIAIMVFSVWKLSQPYFIRRSAIDSNEQAQSDFLIYETSASVTTQALQTTQQADTSASATPQSSATSVTTSPSTQTDTQSVPPDSGTSATQGSTLPPETTPAENEAIWPQFSLNWNAMQRTNPEIIGWIWAYDTTISFPLLQTDNNQKYTYTLYDGVSKGSGGAIFADYRNSPDFTDRNTIIYGHNLNYGVMFGALMYYADES